MSTDLAPVLAAAARGELGRHSFAWKRGASVCVVLASDGYPGHYRTGAAIRGIEDAEATGATVFHAGTRNGTGGLETAGGRVLGVTAAGQDLGGAIKKAYEAAHKIRFEGMHYRTDIGSKGLGRYNIGVPGT
jgi:phosphoribosylamine--glycine ligase